MRRRDSAEVRRVLGHDREVGQEPAELVAVVVPLPDREALEVARPRLVVVAALGGDRPRQVEHHADARLVAQLREQRPGSVDPLGCLLVATLLARHLGQRCQGLGLATPVPDVASERQGGLVELGGSRPVTRQLVRLAEGQPRAQALLVGEQRHETLVVRDGGLVRVGGLGGFGGLPQVLALLLLAVAAPVVVLQQRNGVLEVVRLGALEVLADAPVEHPSQREGEALVGDLLGDDVLEHPCLVGLAIQGHEVEGPQLVQVAQHRVEAAQLLVGAREDRSGEHAADDARHLDGPARPLGRRVDAAQDQRVEALRQPDGLHGVGVGGVDALGDDVVEELLDVERVALGPRRDELDERIRDLGLLADELLHLGADQLGHLVGLHAVQRKLAEPGQPLHAEPATRLRRGAVGEDEQDRQGRGGARQDPEQVT